MSAISGHDASLKIQYIVSEEPLLTRVMFVCTYMAKLSQPLPTEVGSTAKFTELVMNNLNENVVAVNSNYTVTPVHVLRRLIVT